MITVRKLTPDDLTAYRALHREALGEPGSLGFVQNLEEDARVPDAEVAAMLARGEAWGAFKDGALVAKLTIDVLPFAVLAHTRWIHAMYASPAARGTGAARALVEAAIADARAVGALRIMLWVNAENPRARGFYGALGFREAGRIPEGLNIGGRWMDDIMMCLKTGQEG
ncbi:MAG: N-acetyltransferase family protein [Hyphomonadaceae bacterium]